MKNFAKKAAVLTFTISSLIGAEAKATHHELATLGDAVANNKTNEIKAKTNKVITTQAYDATADFKNPPKTFVGASAKFSKSREKNDKWIDPAEIEKREKDAQRVIKLLGGLEGEDLDAKARAENFSIKYLTDLIEKLEEVRQQYDKFVSRGGSEATEEDDVANSNGEEKFSNIKRKVYNIKRKLEKYRAQKEITDAKANGVVTDYTKIAENTKLAEMIKKMHITFEKDEDGVVKVYVNGEYANHSLFDPEDDESYKIFLDAQNIGVIFETKLKDGSILRAKLVSINDTIFMFIKWDDKEWKQRKKTFKLSADKNPAKKEVSMSH